MLSGRSGSMTRRTPRSLPSSRANFRAVPTAKPSPRTSGSASKVNRVIPATIKNTVLPTSIDGSESGAGSLRNSNSGSVMHGLQCRG